MLNGVLIDAVAIFTSLLSVVEERIIVSVTRFVSIVKTTLSAVSTVNDAGYSSN